MSDERVETIVGCSACRDDMMGDRNRWFEQYSKAEARADKLTGLIEVIENLDPQVVDAARAALKDTQP